MSEQNVAIVRDLFSAWSRGDLEAFLGMLDPCVEWRFADNFVYGRTNPLVGRDALRDGSLAALRTEWEGFNALPDDFLDAGAHIVVLGHYVGTFKATGKKLRAQFVHVYTLNGHKIERWRQCVDNQAFADAMGNVPLPSEVNGG